ncbi:MAG TPA: hypothetical protein VJN93_10165 [Candidatus Acidoferrum sp.]|nr:hypothetical protein [Candidatus Acidoferrum sp.]
MKKQETKRPRMPRISEEMKQWSAMLGEEVSKWPDVKSRPMFGMRGFYRRAKIFGALPLTRGVKTPNTFIFRIVPMPPELLRRAKSESRIDLESRVPSAKWYAFEISSTADFSDALWWLGQAYKRAK